MESVAERFKWAIEEIVADIPPTAPRPALSRQRVLAAVDAQLDKLADLLEKEGDRRDAAALAGELVGQGRPNNKWDQMYMDTIAAFDDEALSTPDETDRRWQRLMVLLHFRNALTAE